MLGTRYWALLKRHNIREEIHMKKIMAVLVSVMTGLCVLLPAETATHLIVGISAVKGHRNDQQ